MSEDFRKETTASPETNDDPTAASRKKDHIELAFRSQVERTELDDRFYYEPLLSGHPAPGSWPPFAFLGKTMRAPVWVSSMTGGTEHARTINRNLALACAEFGMGMGLGSCRSLLHSDETLPDFAVRSYIGPDLPLFANLGIAQLEQLVQRNALSQVRRLIDRLEADGLIIHVNPLQEWMQPEGDQFVHPPLATIEAVLAQADYPVIVKEVGQGMGYASLRALLQLPLAAVDFAAAGGTNFAKLELLRGDPVRKAVFERLALVGHTAEEMVELTNRLLAELGPQVRCRQIIISGGIRDFLDGYHLISKIQLAAVYGQASPFLRHARGEYEDLRRHVATQIRGLELARAYLRCK